MKISYAWLKKYLPTIPSPEKTAHLLTQLGLEVNKLTPFELLPSTLCIGKVLTCLKHPNADKLKITTVDVGTETPLNIVCGAPNIAAGQKVIVAPVGTTLTLADGKKLKIKQAKIRGVTSEGMICAEEEIGLAKTQEGILIINTRQSAGTLANTHFNTPQDTILDIELTPNRSDAFAHIGIARELAAVTKKPLEEPIIEPLVADADMHTLQVSTEDHNLCPRYTAVILKNITVSPSPPWLQHKLSSIGVQPINNIVDVTNFVMHEMGQPLHAFDYKQLSSKKIFVQKLPPNTPFTDLHGKTRVLNGKELMICDKKGPLAMAGIIGGDRGKVTPSTKTILLESAYFTPTNLAQTTRYHNLHTDASFRFERGTNPELPHIALQRATNLLQKVAQGTVASNIIEDYPHEIKPAHITTSYAYIEKIIGIQLDPTLIHHLLKKLEIHIINTTEKDLTVQVPTYRVDVRRPADLVEEILRLYGYNNLPETHLADNMYIMPSLKEKNTIKKKKDLATFLAHQSYHQIITNPLTTSKYIHFDKDLDAQKTVHLKNPLTQDLDSLRQTMLFSGLEVIAYNLKHQQNILKLFEVGKVYREKKEYEKLAIWIADDIEHPNWIRKSRKANLQDLYAIVHSLLNHCNISQWNTTPLQKDLYHAYVSLQHANKELLHMGRVHTSILKAMEINTDVFFAQIDLSVLLSLQPSTTHYIPIAKHPAITRDLSLAVSPSITFEQIHSLIKKKKINQVKKFYLIDHYIGKSLAASQRSYTIRFILQDARKTLRDMEANVVMKELASSLEQALGAIIRE